MKARWFPGRLKELREAAALSQAQLAERVGTTVRNISRLETGVQEPTWPMVLALCETFGVDCAEFTKEPERRGPAKRGRPPARDRGKAKRPQG